MKTKKYDFIVVGSGGGAKIARPAANLGFKVAIIEKDKLGGTCLNRGCIPSKMLIHPADIMQEINHAKTFNIKVDKPTINFKKLTKEISESTNKTSNSILENYSAGKIKNLDFFQGEAKFIDDNTIEINGEKIQGDKIIIGVGARPSVPPIKGLSETPFMTSTQALYNNKLPEKLLVIGGGYIGVELGHAYGAFGSDVNFMVRGELIPRVDRQVREEFVTEFKEKYKVHENIEFQEVTYDKKTKIFTIKYTQNKKEKTITGDALLVATGVKINTDTLDIQNTSVKLNQNGTIQVNKKLQTTVPHIYALGDCAGNFMFRHSANFEAEYLFENLVEKKLEVPKNYIKYPPMPWAIFSNPQVAGVGLTQEEANEQEIEVFTGINYYKNSAMGDAFRSKNGLVKLIFEKKTQKLIGAHIVGAEASNMIHMLIVAMSFNATLTDLLEKFIYIHPALPENVRNAARVAKANLKVD